MPIQIELDVFSGRPNPSWSLSDPEAAELLPLLAGLQAAGDTGGLGYRGFLVRQGDASAPLRIGAGRAESRLAEQWLLRNAAAHGHGDIVKGIDPP